MSGLVLCEPTELYNILNQATIYPCLSDTNYLLLLGKTCQMTDDEKEENELVTSLDSSMCQCR